MNAWLESIANIQRKRPPPLDIDIETMLIGSLYACTQCGEEQTESGYYFRTQRNGSQKRAAQQLVERAGAENCAVSAVQATHESKLPYYGTVGGRLVAGGKGLYEIAEVLEKPTPTEAEQRLIVPGLRAGHYLCFFGMHVLTPTVMDLLEEEVARAGDRGIHLTTALAKLAKRERYLACELQGHRYDIGVKYGLLAAQLALALDGEDREEVLSGLVDLLAKRAIK